MLIRLADEIKGIIVNSGLTYLGGATVGGLVYTAERTVEVSRDVNDQPVFKTMRFPSVCNLTPQQCFEDGVLNPLVPNSDKSAIIYTQESRPLNLSGRMPKGGCILSGELVLVGWFNMAKMGGVAISQCGVAGDVFLDMFGLLDGTKHELKDGVVAHIQILGKLVKSTQLFSSYDYAFYNRAFLNYPYDHLGLRVGVSISVAKKCLMQSDYGAPVNCVQV